ncbi:hypothetical protein SAMN04488696_2826 [Methanolobus profundi]|uniref:C2H2-type domain-containing protein n=1 Tax=Methanolobus profundi TaxID=487685 RepID=A0A1I4UPK4_9EURY|nr:hypothetical protein SAMN04488696_2826 [Methanolobus profundi]
MKEENKICECGSIARNLSVTWNKKEYRCHDCYKKYLAKYGVKLH